MSVRYLRRNVIFPVSGFVSNENRNGMGKSNEGNDNVLVVLCEHNFALTAKPA